MSVRCLIIPIKETPYAVSITYKEQTFFYSFCPLSVICCCMASWLNFIITGACYTIKFYAFQLHDFFCFFFFIFYERNIVVTSSFLPTARHPEIPHLSRSIFMSFITVITVKKLSLPNF